MVRILNEQEKQMRMNEIDAEYRRLGVAPADGGVMTQAEAGITPAVLQAMIRSRAERALKIADAMTTMPDDSVQALLCMFYSCIDALTTDVDSTKN